MQWSKCLFERESLTLEPSKSFNLLELIGSAIILEKYQIVEFLIASFSPHVQLEERVLAR